MTTSSRREEWTQEDGNNNEKEDEMKSLKPTLILKHSFGITAQWHHEKSNYMVIAAFNENKTGSYGLTMIAGPWSSTKMPDPNDPLTWVPEILPGYEKERMHVLDRAETLLAYLNAGGKDKRVLAGIIPGQIIGFDDEDTEQ